MIYDFDLIVNCVRLINDQRRLIVRLRVATQLLVLVPGALGTSLVDNAYNFIHHEDRTNKECGRRVRPTRYAPVRL